MDCSPPGSSVHGILQAIILEWFGISFSRGSSWPRDQTWVSCMAGRFFNAEILGKLGSSYMSLQIHSGCYFLSLPSLWILFYYIAKIYKNSSIPSESIWQYNILSKITTLILIVLICKILKRASSVQFSSVQSFSHVQLFATPWIAACQASLSITNSQSPPKLMCIEAVMPSNHVILCRPLLLLPSIFPSIRVFSNESAFAIR